jgi:hypothetical protein
MNLPDQTSLLAYLNNHGVTRLASFQNKILRTKILGSQVKICEMMPQTSPPLFITSQNAQLSVSSSWHCSIQISFMFPPRSLLAFEINWCILKQYLNKFIAFHRCMVLKMQSFSGSRNIKPKACYFNPKSHRNFGNQKPSEFQILNGAKAL